MMEEICDRNKDVQLYETITIKYSPCKLFPSPNKRININGPSPLSLSPHRNRILCDRLIPSRASRNLEAFFSWNHNENNLASIDQANNLIISNTNNQQTRITNNFSNTDSTSDIQANNKSMPAMNIYRSLLKNELLEDNQSSLTGQGLLSPVMRKDIFFKYSHSIEFPDDFHINTGSSPLSPASKKLLRSPVKANTNIKSTPYKILDAPDLQDDFYINLIDWSNQSIICVGLGPSVYLWNSSTCQVTLLTDFSVDNDTVTSLSWCHNQPEKLAIGTQNGFMQIWDANEMKRIVSLSVHSARIGSLSWSGCTIASGSRDRTIQHRDIRSAGDHSSLTRKLLAHNQEICGLKWSPDGQNLASGGNDNKLFLWNWHSLQPYSSLEGHKAAIKAISWSPLQHGLLVSGAGTADRCLRFWNTLTGQLLNKVDTGSQVCNVGWSKTSSELTSTHGYSQNHVIVWNYPDLQKLACLKGHSSRVLYLAVAPDGEAIATGAGDETLRLWNVFGQDQTKYKIASSNVKMRLFDNIRRIV